jgi:hypothetical protein
MTSTKTGQSTTKTGQSTQSERPGMPERPGMTDGVASEFTVMTTIKPGHADQLRQLLTEIMSGLSGAERRHCKRSARCTTRGT